MAFTVPYTFTSGTTILSAQVNENFDLVESRAVDKTGDTLTGTLTTHSLIPSTHNTYDLGSSGSRFAAAWVQGTVTAGTLAVSTISGTITASGTWTFSVPPNIDSPAVFLTDGSTGAGMWFNGNVTSNRAFLGMAPSSDTTFRIHSASLGSDVITIDLPNNIVTIAGNSVFTGSPSIQTSTVPQLSWRDASAGTNEKNWRYVASGAQSAFQVLSDDLGTSADVWRIERVAAAATKFRVAPEFVAETSVTHTGVISPAQLTADQNDYNPTGLSNAFIVRIDASGGDAIHNITGLVAQSAGRLITLANIGTTGTFSLSGESASSTAANRFRATSPTISIGNSVTVWYDSVTSRWQIYSVSV